MIQSLRILEFVTALQVFLAPDNKVLKKLYPALGISPDTLIRQAQQKVSKKQLEQLNQILTG